MDADNPGPGRDAVGCEGDWDDHLLARLEVFREVLITAIGLEAADRASAANWLLAELHRILTVEDCGEDVGRESAAAAESQREVSRTPELVPEHLPITHFSGVSPSVQRSCSWPLVVGRRNGAARCTNPVSVGREYPDRPPFTGQ